MRGGSCRRQDFHICTLGQACALGLHLCTSAGFEQLVRCTRHGHTRNPSQLTICLLLPNCCLPNRTPAHLQLPNPIARSALWHH